jgi:guanosine-3',5'-bis(diphosphate) 3'-pyrophosphohydrolase
VGAAELRRNHDFHWLALIASAAYPWQLYGLLATLALLVGPFVMIVATNLSLLLTTSDIRCNGGAAGVANNRGGGASDLRGSDRSGLSASGAAKDGGKMRNMSLVLRAAAFAARKHTEQRRKDAAASPYINHPLAVAAILADEGKIDDPVVIAAALLHDTVEDTETSIEEIAGVFGPEVAAIVGEVTDDKALPKAERKRLQVAKGSSKSQGAKLVKLADKIANLRDIAGTPPQHWDEARRCAYFDWAEEVVSALGPVNPELEAAFQSAASARPAPEYVDG